MGEKRLNHPEVLEEEWITQAREKKNDVKRMS